MYTYYVISHSSYLRIGHYFWVYFWFIQIVKCSNGRLECALLTWDHRKFWDFPFGKRDPGEHDPKITATRESYEAKDIIRKN